MIRRPPISTLFPYPTLFRSFDYGQQPHRVDVSSGGAVFSSNGAQLTLSLVREAADERLGQARVDGTDVHVTLPLEAGQIRGVVLQTGADARPREVPPRSEER